MEKKLIITADDYGMCAIVNDAIDRCVEAGLVTSTNVILNMDDKQRAATLRSKYPTLSVGLHWNVTAGFPLLPATKVPTLVDDTGRFHSVKVFKQRFAAGQIAPDQVVAELTAQYEEFCRLCGRPDYWNTHQNSAVDFKSFPLFNSTALSLGIQKSRSFRRVYVADKGLAGTKALLTEALKKVLFDVWFGNILPKTGVLFPDGRMMYFSEEHKFKPGNFHTNIRWGNKRLVELVIHPATGTDFEYFGTIASGRVEEYRVFSNPETKKQIETAGISLANFDAVASNR